MTHDLDAWRVHVDGVPHEPWDVYTDFPRDAARWQETLGAGVVKDVVMDSVPLATGGEWVVQQVRCDEHSILAAVAVALGASDHGRAAIWVLDRARLPGADLPVRVTLEGSLEDVRNRIQRERDLVASTWTAAVSESEGSKEAAAALLRERAARPPSAAQPAGAVCQLSLQRGSKWEASPAGSPPPDLCVLLDGSSELEGDAAGHASISLAYRGDLFRAESARAIAAHASALLQTGQPWGSLQVEAVGRVLVGEEEAARLSDAWQGERAPFERDSCIHSLFERVARGEAADRVALIPFDKAEAPWSYAQLDMAAGLVARALLSLCVEPGGRSPLLIRRSCLLVAAIYGTLRAGQAYVPLDPDWPADRQCVVIEDVEASAVVLGEGLDLPGQCQGLPVVKLSPSPPGALAECPLTAAAHPAPGGRRRDLLPREAAARVTADMTVYILYTSGTTGKPKGVNVPHRGLVGRTQWLQRTWPLGREAVVAQKTPATFAISEWELFWPLCFGAKLALAADGLHGDPQHVVRLLSDHSVTHSVFVPSLLEQLLDELDSQDLPALRLIIACGEALKASTALASLRGLPGTELVNLYGPTEGSMTMLRLPPSPSVEHLFRCPIGAPIDNTLVLCATGGDGQDSVAAMELAPVLSKGELLFGGPLIALGYWQRPELTREKFVDNPFGPGKVYRTGDLGRWRADGTLEFLGRADSQVKFNGVRIELSELEGALAALPGVRSTAAFLVPPHHLVIACALVAAPAAARSAAGNTSPVNGGAPDSALQVDEREERRLWEGLRAVLPKDRLPTRLEILSSLPVTDRGKVDRRKLVDGFQQREAQRAAARAPPAVNGSGPECCTGSATEVLLEELMREVLDVTEPLSLTVTFQNLGFSSLLLGKLTTRIRRAVSLPGLPATAVYKHPCAQALAGLIDVMREEQAASAAKNGEAGGADGGQGELVPAQRVWGGRSPTSVFGWVCTFATMTFDCVVSEFSFLPAYYIFFEVYSRHGMWLVCLSSGFIILLDMVWTLLFIALLKWLIIGQRKEGAFPVYSSYYWKWRFMHTIESYAEEHLSAYFTDTAIYNIFLRLYGAEIGPGARVNFAHISEVDLVTIGENARIERDATLCPARIWNGELHLQRISVGAGSLVAHRAYMAGGTSLPPSMELSAMSSSDPMGPYHVKPRGRTFSSDAQGPAEEPGHDERAALSWLQLFVGVPAILAVETLSEVPVFFALSGLWSALADRLSRPVDTGRFRQGERHDMWGWGWVTGQGRGYTLEDKHHVVYPFVALIPWVMTFVHGGAYFLLVVCIKRFLVGKFKEGQVVTSWDRFCHWLIERLTTTPTFDHFMELWVNTEMLSVCYRLLGAHIAPRVNMDFFGAVEYDLLHIETDVVFGSSVLLVNTLGGVNRSVALRKGACVLDHSCVLPGSVVPEGALLGSFTVVPTGQHLEPMTVYTGNEQGACVRLFQRPLLPGERTEGERVVTVTEPVPADQGKDRTLALPAAARRQRALEAEALMHHWSGRFYLFNAWCAASAVVFAPLPDVVYWATIVIDFEVYDYFGNSETGELVAVLLMGPLYIVVTLGMLAVICALKWTLIGRWQAGDRPYYTWFHFRWAALMVAFASLDDLLRSISGTWLAVLFMRCMGATVGQRVCFFGHGFEFDLLHIGDEVCIGPSCDVTAHTVENMVMKMEQVRFENGCSCLGGSVVMPGGVMEEGSTLIEHSQVLKGDSVPAGAFFGGLPAKLLSSYDGLAAAPGPLPKVLGGRATLDGARNGWMPWAALGSGGSSATTLSRMGIELPTWKKSSSGDVGGYTLLGKGDAEAV